MIHLKTLYEDYKSDHMKYIVNLMILNNNEEGLKKIIDGGWDVNTNLDSKNNTALFNVIKSDDNSKKIRLAKLLIDNGADVDYVNNFQRTALNYTLAFNKRDYFNLLLKHGANINKIKYGMLDFEDSMRSWLSNSKVQRKLINIQSNVYFFLKKHNIFMADEIKKEFSHLDVADELNLL